MSKLKGIVSIFSNSPYVPTGYGIQAGYLVDRLKRDGIDVAALSNFGLEGRNSTLVTPSGEIPHYARGFENYTNDVVVMNHVHHVNTVNGSKAKKDKLKELLITLYDVWVFKGKAWDGVSKIASWTPLDHVTIPPGVLAWLKKPNVIPIAMSPHGVRQMQENGLKCEYVPHAVDTKLMKPTYEVNGVETRKFMNLGKNDFVVGMNAANKAGGLLHRKAFAENIMAFSIFAKNKPEAKLYLHTDPYGGAGGWNLFVLCESLGIKPDQVIFPNMADYKHKIDTQTLAAFYTVMDVMLASSYGEGFGVPTIEAQSCGTRVIGSNWAATPDLVSEDCWLVDGQPSWDAGLNAWWHVPSVPSIVNALEEAYKVRGVKSQKSIDFVKQFDVEVVWEKYWLPLLKKLLA
jgi:glycosyltransferase involved in cell wall biosynthesis